MSVRKDCTKDGWFLETSTLWPGQAMAIEVEEQVFHQRSKFQDVKVFKTKTYGNMLVLDGVIQCTERDEFSYQEMIVNLPVNSHPKPEKVLVIGGGDGGVVRELAKHSAVKHVVMCEIDELVVETSRKFLPFMASGFDSPKLTLHIGDGFEFMKQHKNEFDVIITDSSDPVGPAESLFQREYYELMKSALRPGGVVCTQGECMWLHLNLIADMLDFCRDLFPSVDYAYTTVPTYPSGQIGFVLAGLSPDTSFRSPVRMLSEQQVCDMALRYYNPEVHRAAFMWPQFVKQALEKKAQNGTTNGHAVTKDDSHAVTKDDSHAVTKDDSHAVTKDDSHAVTKDDSHAVTKDDSHAVTKDDSHAVTKDDSHAVTSSNGAAGQAV